MGNRPTVIVPAITLKIGGAIGYEKRLIDELVKLYDVVRIAAAEDDFGHSDNVRTILISDEGEAATRAALSGVSADLILWPAIFGYAPVDKLCKTLWIVAVHNRMPDYPGIVTIDEVIKETGSMAVNKSKEVGA